MALDLNELFKTITDTVKKQDPEGYERAMKAVQVQLIQEAFKFAISDKICTSNGKQISSLKRKKMGITLFGSIFNSLEYSNEEARKFMAEALNGKDIVDDSEDNK